VSLQFTYALYTRTLMQFSSESLTLSMYSIFNGLKV